MVHYGILLFFHQGCDCELNPPRDDYHYAFSLTKSNQIKLEQHGNIGLSKERVN